MIKFCKLFNKCLNNFKILFIELQVKSKHWRKKNMNQKTQIKKISAFSLIELSIVLLIIGIIIAGITQSSLLVSKYKLTTARSQTQNSPVASISGVNFWFDAVSEKSFSQVDASNDAQIDSWFDINPTSTTKYNASSLGSSRPKYLSNCINDLPCLSFDGVDDYLEIADLNVGFTSFAVAAVIKTDLTSGDWDYIFDTIPKSGNDYVGDGYASLHITPVGTIQFVQYYAGHASSASSVASFSGLKSPYLIFAQDKTGISHPLRINGFEKNQGKDGVLENGEKNIKGVKIGLDSYGSGGYFKGEIGEIIFFDRYLSAAQINDIEQYLIKKWGIKN